jgi:hypothetical protein
MADKIQLIDNFLNKETFNKIKSILIGQDFPFYYQNQVAFEGDLTDFYFNHHFYKNNSITSSYFNEIVLPILNPIKFKKLLRAKCNLYTKKAEHIPNEFHTDSNEKHKVLLYSVNTNNGYTMFKSGEKIKSNENQLIIFDGLLEHCSVAQTDEKIRVNVNINIEE